MAELLRETYSPNTRGRCRRNMKVWIRDLKTKTACDDFINFMKGRYTEVGIFAIDDGVTPKQWGGSSIMGTPSATSINGKTPWAYLYDNLHRARIRVIAWMWITHYSYWGSPNGVDLDIPNNSTYNDAGIWNFHNATARELIIDELRDFYDNNRVDGMVFNMEGTTANIVTQDMTDFVIGIRNAIPDIQMAWHVGAGVGNDAVYKMDSANWLRNGYIDTLYLMGYFDAQEDKCDYLNREGISKMDSRICAGWSTETSRVCPSDYRHKSLLFKNDGYQSIFHFVWADNYRDDVALRETVDDYINGTLTAVQAPITKVSVTPGTSFTLVVDGVTQTTNYADVTDHLYAGPLKLHVEAAIGSENPAVYYNRLNSTTTYIFVGDDAT